MTIDTCTCTKLLIVHWGLWGPRPIRLLGLVLHPKTKIEFLELKIVLGKTAVGTRISTFRASMPLYFNSGVGSKDIAKYNF